MFKLIKRKLQDWIPFLRNDEYYGYEYISIPFPTHEEMTEYYRLIKSGMSNKQIKALHIKKHAKVLVGNKDLYLHDIEQSTTQVGLFTSNYINTIRLVGTDDFYETHLRKQGYSGEEYRKAMELYYGPNWKNIFTDLNGTKYYLED